MKVNGYIYIYIYIVSELHDDDSEEEEEENSNSMKVFGIRNLDGNSLIDLEEVMKEQPESMEAYYSYEESGFWIFLGISLGLTLFAGLMSGLTVGYLSIDELVLEMKLKNGTPQEIRDVHVIYYYVGIQNNAYLE